MCAQKLVRCAAWAAHQLARSSLHAHIFTTESGDSLRACAVAFKRRHRPAGKTSLRPKCGNYLTIEVLEKSSKTDDATRRGTSWSQALSGKSGAVQQAQVLRSVGALAFDYCAVYVLRRELLQDSTGKQFVGYFQTALAQEKHLPALHSVVESLRLVSAIGLSSRRAWLDGVARGRGQRAWPEGVDGRQAG